MSYQRVEVAVAADRERIAGCRRSVEAVLQLAQRLPAHERGLVEAVYRDGRSPTDIARSVGQPPRRFQRKLNAIMQRIGDPMFLFVARRLDELPGELRPVARRSVLQGLSQRQTAEATGRSLHTVRMQLHTLRTLAEAPHATTTSSGSRMFND
jgi:DNA-directed RNA polymerase specialized sigma24 family protein